MTCYEYCIKEAELYEEMALKEEDPCEKKEWKKQARICRKRAKELLPEVASREWRGECL